MKGQIPTYVTDRICRSSAAFSHVVPDSTPVIAFGNPWNSFAATVGINPSRLEFLGADGRLLDGKNRRLATLQSLRLDRLASANSCHVARIVDDSSEYFQRNPYNA